MSFNGSGVFVRSYNWVSDKSTGIKITDARNNNEDDGIATGLSNVICKDGQQTTIASIPFASGINISDGTVGTPAVKHISDGDTGLYRIGANNIGIACGGAKVWDFGTATASTSLSLVVGGTFSRGNNDILPFSVVQFPATASPSSNVNCLDDYEEGTWTPIVNSEVGQITSFNTLTASYVKIGKLVSINITIDYTSTVEGAIYLSGFPFTPNSTTDSWVPGWVASQNGSETGRSFLVIRAGQNRGDVYNAQSEGSLNWDSLLFGPAQMSFNGHYISAS